MRSFLRLELSTQIVLGLLFGIIAGVFFGERCEPLSVVGDAFVGLLRMTVVPYIGVTLIASLGRLTFQESRRLARIGGIVLLLLWAVALACVVIIPTSFPQWKSGSFFSTALTETPRQRDLLSRFIPANIFESLADNQVPAIVLFCIFAGLALAKAERRQILLAHFDIVADVLLRVSVFITKLAPIGIFAIAAATAGTVSLDEIVRLQAYLVAYTAGAVFLGLIALPLMITTVTPLSYRQVLRVVREPVITAFATGKLIIVLPMLVQNTERLFREAPIETLEGEAPPVEALYATGYPFPHVGKLLSMMFIPFAAWFLGTPTALDQYPSLLVSGLFSYFGGPIVAIPFLLDQMHLPHDMFQLFLVAGVYGERLGDAVGAVHLATLTLISTFGFRRALRFHLRDIIRYLCVTLLTGIVFLVGVRFFLYHSIASAELRVDVITRMQLLEQPVEHTIIKVGTPNPDPLLPGESLLERIRRRGILRVGFNEDKVPFAFFNQRGKLVGYDINMAHALARDLSVKLEFVRFKRSTLKQQLDADHFDVVMSGLVGTLERSATMQHTRGYMDVTLAFVVPDHKARYFQTLDSIHSTRQLRIGFVDLSSGFAERLREVLPEAELIEISNNHDYFRDNKQELDALLMSAESGSAFTLIHLDYEVVIPTDLRVKLPLFYAINGKGTETKDFLEHWITLRKKDGTAKEYYEHWVLGKTDGGKKPRWCIIRDVLHWL